MGAQPISETFEAVDRLLRDLEKSLGLESSALVDPLCFRGLLAQETKDALICAFSCSLWWLRLGGGTELAGARHLLEDVARWLDRRSEGSLSSTLSGGLMPSELDAHFNAHLTRISSGLRAAVARLPNSLKSDFDLAAANLKMPTEVVPRRRWQREWRRVRGAVESARCEIIRTALAVADDGYPAGLLLAHELRMLPTIATRQDFGLGLFVELAELRTKMVQHVQVLMGGFENDVRKKLTALLYRGQSTVDFSPFVELRTDKAALWKDTFGHPAAPPSSPLTEALRKPSIWPQVGVVAALVREAARLPSLSMGDSGRTKVEAALDALVRKACDSSRPSEDLVSTIHDLVVEVDVVISCGRNASVLARARARSFSGRWERALKTSMRRGLSIDAHFGPPPKQFHLKGSSPDVEWVWNDQDHKDYGTILKYAREVRLGGHRRAATSIASHGVRKLPLLEAWKMQALEPIDWRRQNIRDPRFQDLFGAWLLKTAIVPSGPLGKYRWRSDLTQPQIEEALKAVDLALHPSREAVDGIESTGRCEREVSPERENAVTRVVKLSLRRGADGSLIRDAHSRPILPEVVRSLGPKPPLLIALDSAAQQFPALCTSEPRASEGFVWPKTISESFLVELGARWLNVLHAEALNAEDEGRNEAGAALRRAAAGIVSAIESDLHRASVFPKYRMDDTYSRVDLEKDMPHCDAPLLVESTSVMRRIDGRKRHEVSRIRRFAVIHRGRAQRQAGPDSPVISVQWDESQGSTELALGERLVAALAARDGRRLLGESAVTERSAAIARLDELAELCAMGDAKALASAHGVLLGLLECLDRCFVAEQSVTTADDSAVHVQRDAIDYFVKHGYAFDPRQVVGDQAPFGESVAGGTIFDVPGARGWLREIPSRRRVHPDRTVFGTPVIGIGCGIVAHEAWALTEQLFVELRRQHRDQWPMLQGFLAERSRFVREPADERLIGVIQSAEVLQAELPFGEDPPEIRSAIRALEAHLEATIGFRRVHFHPGTSFPVARDQGYKPRSVTVPGRPRGQVVRIAQAAYQDRQGIVRIRGEIILTA